MIESNWFRLDQIERRVCEIASENLAIPLDRVKPDSSLVADLGCDSLELVELIMDLEDAFGVTIPNELSPNPIYKSLFIRQPFRLADLAEIVYLQQGTGAPVRKRWRTLPVEKNEGERLPFTQLGGRWNCDTTTLPLFELLEANGPTSQYRRRSDGMRCVLIPSATVEIGSDSSEALADEKPLHTVEIDSFLMDAEPISTTAYCRFLNSVDERRIDILRDWFILDQHDDRNEHVLIEQINAAWQPRLGTQRWPMMLVSWYGANAYSLWANGRDWSQYRNEHDSECGCFLPSEAQWEYAARGARHQMFPWGDESTSASKMRFGQHRRSNTYLATELPMADVNEQLGMSPFGLHHMAGNVWQWCGDWYDDSFYLKPESKLKNPVNCTGTGVRSERGGSWVGPAELCRSSYRRGRSPYARGRCLGFRCISIPSDLQK